VVLGVVLMNSIELHWKCWVW